MLLEMATDIIRADTSFSYPRPHPKPYARARAHYPLRAPIHARARYPPDRIIQSDAQNLDISTM
jgi:hypothetical protein